MLAEEEDTELDDTHLCIKCGSTVEGIENYIKHRKANCTQQQQQQQPAGKSSGDGTVPSYDYHNYELESHHHHHHHEHHEHHADPVHHRSDGSKAAGADYKNEVNFEYELGADLFFYSLELQSSSKQKQQAATQPGPSAGGVTGAGCIPSDKLMKAVSAISGHKKVELYPIFHQESPEPSDDDSEDEECDYNAPPRTHTGGKWKPENRPSPNALRSTSQWRHWPPGSPLDKCATGEPDEEDTDCFKSFPPPPGHTRGKWVPGSKITRLEYKRSEAPVRGYEDNYWCSICNRRLASRHVYERHLQSNLHLKRAQEECELERAIKPTLSTVVKPLEETDTTAARDEGKRKRKCYYTKCAVCKTRLPTHLLGKHLISRYHYRRMLNHPRHSFDVVLKNMHRIVLQAPFQCQPCRFYANSEHYFMEHWRSGEHEARVAGSGGKFWCSFCKFECEGNFQMTAHLMGANHREVIAVINRSVPIIIRKITRIRCSCCEQEFRYNAELRQHQRHCGAVSEQVIDEVRVQVQNTFACELCPASFPDRTRLLQHGQKLHRLGNYYCSICECLFETARESVQHRRTSKHKIMSARKPTNTCPPFPPLSPPISFHARMPSRTGESKISSNHVTKPLRPRAVQTVDMMENYSPTTGPPGQRSSASTPLGIKLESLRPTVRQPSPTVQRPAATTSAAAAATSAPSTVVSNSDCDNIVAGRSPQASAEIFFTMANNAPAPPAKITCPLCGKAFSKASLRCHLRQHTDERLYRCPHCPMAFTRKANRKNHIDNIHHEQRPVGTAGAPGDEPNEDAGPSRRAICTSCGKSFANRHIMLQHSRVHHDQRSVREFACQHEGCHYLARSATDARRHLVSHTSERNFACSEPGCDYRGKSLAQLRRHALFRHEELEKKYKCDQCDFATHIPGHLRRHLLVHSGSKPFSCPHCDYSCNNIENLRKHVISTAKHKGKFLYECKFCPSGAANEASSTPPYGTNFQKEFKDHLQH
ncbi:AGAP009025-PA, partial [Anopheles gambiae str. PEST]